MVVEKLVEEQGIDSPETLVSLYDDINVIYNVVMRPGGLVSGRMLDSGNQICILAAKNIKLAALMFKMM